MVTTTVVMVVACVVMYEGEKVGRREGEVDAQYYVVDACPPGKQPVALQKKKK